jgi:hypothetical protein
MAKLFLSYAPAASASVRQIVSADKDAGRVVISSL